MKFQKLSLVSHRPLASRDMLGVEFLTNNLRIAYAKTVARKREIVQLFSKPIGGFQDVEITKLISDAVKQLKLKSAYATVIVPGALAITKNIEVPSVHPQEIREIINLQAGRHTPYSRDEIAVDYITIGTYKNSYTKILLVIVARSVIERQCNILERAGLRIESVVFAPEGLASSVSKMLRIETKDSPLSVIHVDEYCTDFTVIFKNKLIFMRSIPIGVQQVLSERQKYQMKFIEELKKSQEAYQNEDIEKNPLRAVLTGAVQEMADLEPLLNAALRIEIRVIPYLKSVALSEQVLKLASENRRQSFLNVMTALVSKEELNVELTPENLKVRRHIEERGKDLVMTGIYALLILVIIFASLITTINFKSEYVKQLNRFYEPLKKDVQELEESFTKITLIRNFIRRQGYSLEILAEIYNLLPEELELNYVRFDEQGKLLVRGTANSMNTIFSFVETMSKSPYFKEVKTRYTTKRKDGTRDVADFELVAELKS